MAAGGSPENREPIIASIFLVWALWIAPKIYRFAKWAIIFIVNVATFVFSSVEFIVKISRRINLYIWSAILGILGVSLAYYYYFINSNYVFTAEVLAGCSLIFMSLTLLLSKAGIAVFNFASTSLSTFVTIVNETASQFQIPPSLFITFLIIHFAVHVSLSISYITKVLHLKSKEGLLEASTLTKKEFSAALRKGWVNSALLILWSFVLLILYSYYISILPV